MKIIGNNVTRDEAELIAQYIRNGIDTLKASNLGRMIPRNAKALALNVLEIKRRPDTSSRAYADLIRMNLGYWQVGNPVHIEYKRFNHDPIIGQIPCSCPEEHWLVSSMHELAHHVQYAHCVKEYPSVYRKPHGEGFQLIYRVLRRDYVNPALS